MQEQLLTIGRLAKLTGVSVDTVRYYGERGLILPTYITPETGYRYYHMDQVEALTHIRQQRSFGFSLDEIKEMQETPHLSRQIFYQKRYRDLRAEKLKLEQLLSQLAHQLQEDRPMKKRILIIDDAPFMIRAVTGILTHEGYEVVGSAQNGADGLALYSELKPDVVLLDILMPIKDGIETLKAMTQIDPHACVVMLTASGMMQRVSEVLALGAKGFVVKPFQPEGLCHAIEVAFTRSIGRKNGTLTSLVDFEAVTKDIVLRQEELNQVLAAVYQEPEGAPVFETLKALVAEETGVPIKDGHEQTHDLLKELILGQKELIALLKTGKKKN